MKYQELRDALKPFADFADALSEEVPNGVAIGLLVGGVMYGPSSPTVQDLRKARAALSQGEQK